MLKLQSNGTSATWTTCISSCDSTDSTSFCDTRHQVSHVALTTGCTPCSVYIYFVTRLATFLLRVFVVLSLSPRVTILDDASRRASPTPNSKFLPSIIRLIGTVRLNGFVTNSYSLVTSIVRPSVVMLDCWDDLWGIRLSVYWSRGTWPISTRFSPLCEL